MGKLATTLYLILFVLGSAGMSWGADFRRELMNTIEEITLPLCPDIPACV